MKGHRFRNLDEFRSAFWFSMSRQPALMNQYSPQNQAAMSRGKPPLAPSHLAYHARLHYELHLKRSVEVGGSPYDLDNLEVLAPKAHVAAHQQSVGNEPGTK